MPSDGCMSTHDAKIVLGNNDPPVTKGEQTRKRILEKAAVLFNQRGFEGCAISELMEATGLEKGGIYKHFANKEELALEAFRFAAEWVTEARIGNLDSIDGALPKLRTIVERFLTEPSPIPGGCPLLNAAIDTDDGNPAIRKLARASFAEWRRRIASIVEDGIASGEIRRSADPIQVADTMISTIEGALAVSRILGNRTPLENVRAPLESMLNQLEPAQKRTVAR
jgi:TetR/AcrR family transcriptional regulator, transcriptional repressor for nem operon